MYQGGVWMQGAEEGIDWSNVRTTTNKAFGTQDGNGAGSAQYNDSVAALRGTFGTDQYTRGVAFSTRGAGDFNTEVELLLRWTIWPHVTTGYEVEFSARSDSPYFDIVRWNGALGDFTPLTLSTGGTHLASMPGGAVVTGDVLEAFIVGNTISGYKNGTLMATATDSTYTSGNPGVGHFLHNLTATGDPTQYGFSEYTARTLDVRDWRQVFKRQAVNRMATY
jgi:hypothetical protein